jgi:diguanylate cyclase (GGDEF)-like protein
MIYLLYLLMLFPWATGFLENGRFPFHLREVLSELSLSILIAIGVYTFIKLRNSTRDHAEEIKRLSITDSLTGLGNVRLLEEVLVREVARARRTDRPLSCILLDLDDFRILNNQFGLEKGNQVLQVAARTVREVIREGMDIAFRYGGDEFIILLPEADSHQALGVAQRLREAFIALQPPAIPKRSLPSSFGLAELRDGQRADDLMITLDRALTHAKSKGKNIIYDAQLFDS